MCMQNESIQFENEEDSINSNFLATFTRKEFIADAVTEVYRVTNEPFIGI